jgi:hypothetical protein
VHCGNDVVILYHRRGRPAPTAKETIVIKRGRDGRFTGSHGNKIGRIGVEIDGEVQSSGSMLLLTRSYASTLASTPAAGSTPGFTLRSAVADISLQRRARTRGCTMKISTPMFLATALFAASPAAASSWQFPLLGSPSPFTTLPNTPLVFGMDVDDVSRVLGQPLRYVSGRPGNEIYLAVRDTSSNRVFHRRDLLYLQFRKGRLTGWKGDSGYNWIWQW